MKFIVLLVVLMTSFVINAQVITVVDKTTQQTLPGVLVFVNGQNQSLYTNAKGKIDISSFKSADTIYFKFIGYILSFYSYNEIEKLKFKIELVENPISLSEVTIYSNRWEENKLETPSRIEKLNMKEVAFQNPQTTADLLGTSGYAFIQKSQLGGGSPMLRGMATNRVLLVVDGVRMNNAIFRSGNLQNVISLDANALESTEILFGPGSVMYGSDAIGGVMDFHTLNPKFSDTTNKTLLASGSALMRTSTANSEKTSHIDINIGVKKWAFVTSFTSSEYGDLRSGTVGGVNYFYRPYYVQTISNKDYMIPNNDSTLQVGSKYSQINFMQKLRFKPNKSWEIDYGFHFSETSPYNRYDRLYVMQTSGPYKNKLRWAEWYYGPQKWNMNRVGITHSKVNFIYDHLRVIGAIQNFEESRYDREFMVRELRMQKETVKALSLNIDLDKKLNQKVSINYGAELVQNTVGSFATLTHVITKETDSTVTRYPNGSEWSSYGAYVNLKYKLTKKLVVSLGSRYSHYKITAKFDTTFFAFPFTDTKMSNGALNGSLGFVYAVNNSWQVYLNGATGFRAPNIDDMGKVFESTPGYLVVPNPKLKPEQVYNAEIGTVKTFGRFLKIDFAGYYSLLNDAMERKDFLFNGQPTIRYLGNSSKIQAVQNVVKIKVYGIQAGIELNYNGFGLRSTFSYQYGREQSTDSLIYYPLRHAAPMFGGTHLTYQRKKLKLDFYAVYNGKMDYEDLALTERVNTSYARDYTKNPNGLAYVAGWYTLNFKVALYLSQYVAITAGVENIEDKLYRPYSSGINAPGRNFIASLSAKF
jgi:hemoglobin/transferrin/lactoferrin receptor protein